MSRRGNYHDTAVAERFFQLLKGEGIKKKIYGTREGARSDIFDYIKMFYNSKRRHGSSGQISPTEYENQYYQRLESVQIVCGDSMTGWGNTFFSSLDELQDYVITSVKNGGITVELVEN